MADCGLNPSAVAVTAGIASLTGRPLDELLEGHCGGGPWGPFGPSVSAREQQREMPSQLPIMVGGAGTAQLDKLDKLVVARGWEGAAALLRSKAAAR
jgi:hypothetical protein